MHAGGPRGPREGLAVVEEDDLPRLGPEALARQQVDPRIGLEQAHLMRVHEVVHEVLVPIGGLLTLTGASTAVGQDAGLVARPQRACPLDQLGVGSAEVNAPEAFHDRAGLIGGNASAGGKLPVHFREGDRADVCAIEDASNAAAELLLG